MQSNHTFNFGAFPQELINKGEKRPLTGNLGDLVQTRYKELTFEQNVCNQFMRLSVRRPFACYGDFSPRKANRLLRCPHVTGCRLRQTHGHEACLGRLGPQPVGRSLRATSRSACL